MPKTVPVFSHTDRSHLQCQLLSPSAHEWCILRVALRKCGAHITLIYASEDNLYLRCFEEHRDAEWVALSTNTGLMKEMSECNLAWLSSRHRHHAHTHPHIYTLSLFPFSSGDFGRWRPLCLARKFSNLEKATPLQFNEGKPQQRCSNDWIVYNIIPPPPGQSLCIHRRLSFSHHRAREGRENKRASPMLTQ